MNYWKLKRGLEVAIVASTRAMTGQLLHRERLQFGDAEVINYRAPVVSPFEGSIEIEVFSTQNMVIPYSAIVCHYQTQFGFCMVHGYARAYSAHEMEEGRTLSTGREACWTLRDTDSQHSFAVVHNGSRALPAQTLHLCITNHRQERRQVSIDWSDLQAYETRRVLPARHLPDLAAWLDGKTGHAKLDFELGGAFSRMLVGNERNDGSDLQVTHSNFDYSRQPTDMAEPGQAAYMHVPALGGLPLQALVYPDAFPGTYSLANTNHSSFFSAGQAVSEPINGPSTLRFERTDGPMPTRLVTALELHADPARLPCECSLGVITALQPPKRLWWGSVPAPELGHVSLVVHDLPEIYGGVSPAAELSFSLHSAHQAAPIKAVLPASLLPQLGNGMPIEQIWPTAREHLNGAAGYFTLFCLYGGLTAYTLTRNEHNSVCLEHGF